LPANTLIGRIKRASIDLSRQILYAAFSTPFAGATLAHAFFSLFASYVLRVLILAKRTLATGALVPRDSE